MEYNAYDRAGRWAMLRLYLYINSFLFLCYIGMLGFAFFIHIFMIIFLYDTNNNKVLIIIVAKFNIIDAIFYISLKQFDNSLSYIMILNLIVCLFLVTLDIR